MSYLFSKNTKYSEVNPKSYITFLKSYMPVFSATNCAEPNFKQEKEFVQTDANIAFLNNQNKYEYAEKGDFIDVEDNIVISEQSFKSEWSIQNIEYADTQIVDDIMLTAFKHHFSDSYIIEDMEKDGWSVKSGENANILYDADKPIAYIPQCLIMEHKNGEIERVYDRPDKDIIQSLTEAYANMDCIMGANAKETTIKLVNQEDLSNFVQILSDYADNPQKDAILGFADMSNNNNELSGKAIIPYKVSDVTSIFLYEQITKEAVAKDLSLSDFINEYQNLFDNKTIQKLTEMGMYDPNNIDLHALINEKIPKSLEQEINDIKTAKMQNPVPINNKSKDEDIYQH